MKYDVGYLCRLTEPMIFFKGYRMPAPMGTPEACYDLMMKCWQYDPNERDHFDRIKKELHSIYKSL